MDFKAAMFDFDGTVTDKGKFDPPQKLIDKIAELGEKMPVAFCTGRQLESFEKRALAALISSIEPKKLHGFLENLYLIAENGSLGYSFNTKLDKLEEFYRAKWPKEFLGRAKLKEILQKEVDGLGYVHDDMHQVVVIIRTIYTGTDRIEETYDLSAKIFKICHEVLGEYDSDYGDYFNVGDSGIGCVICPADADKDNGILQFGEYLKKTRNIQFDEDFREILVVGDQHQKGGNDYHFLNGKYGTAYTVGHNEVIGQCPKPVVSDDGSRLFNSDGTLFLLNKLF